ncbi:type VII secretion-associated serine protease mycosin [Pseudonocardia oceani]|uniref:Type VII secretion-associated serine protease mycosin n=1 Tax=Pseudonocardia oceani TaxID=2792013 RepID=A0ABS6U6U2_9PSEU|nr:type VII secretion-associated serine protease mycosin [Pseudonocardia oceani]MBW0122191.1 type VII secretion-associated serine protease mycosin [Pseudonocardia oceani]MBW0127951.1 type VII secretion-associated serine protease mycosin [Pseudonocardia oceani]
MRALTPVLTALVLLGTGAAPAQAAAAPGCAPLPAGTAVPPDPPPAHRLRLADAHRLATGAGVLVAVIDTGVAPHPRLAGRLRGGGDLLTGGGPGTGLDDCDGHGTAVAGLIAAAPSPDDEVVGVAPGATLLAIRQAGPSSAPGPDGRPRTAGDLTTLAEGVVLAVQAGADVVNVSEAVCLPPERAGAGGSRLQAALRLAADADVVVVAAAGNAGVGGCGDEPGPVSLPGWYDEVVAVGATGPDDAAAAFTVAGHWVDLAAPGTGARSLAVGGGLTAEPPAGTSFSAPLVSGLAALVRERFPELTAAQVVDRVVATARRPAGGRDDALGAGTIDAVAALTAEPAVLTAPAAASSTGALLGTGPGAIPSAPPLDLAAVAVLLGTAAALAAHLRRRDAARGVSPAARPPSAPPR